MQYTKTEEARLEKKNFRHGGAQHVCLWLELELSVSHSTDSQRCVREQKLT